MQCAVRRAVSAVSAVAVPATALTSPRPGEGSGVDGAASDGGTHDGHGANAKRLDTTRQRIVALHCVACFLRKVNGFATVSVETFLFRFVEFLKVHYDPKGTLFEISSSVQ